jgi:hypothetical protein
MSAEQRPAPAIRRAGRRRGFRPRPGSKRIFERSSVAAVALSKVVSVLVDHEEYRVGFGT